MLAFLTTDAAIPAGRLQRYLRGAVGESFNCISVDGDCSTNDTVLLMANGASGEKSASQNPAKASPRMTRLKIVFIMIHPYWFDQLPACSSMMNSMLIASSAGCASNIAAEICGCRSQLRMLTVNCGALSTSRDVINSFRSSGCSPR